MTRDNNPDRGDDGARAEAEMNERAIGTIGHVHPSKSNLSSALSAPQGDYTPISAQDPLAILAGIKQFGLASDGADLRDLETAIHRLARPISPQDDDGLVGRLDEIASGPVYGGTASEAAATLRSQTAEISGLTEKLQNAEAVWHGYASECEQLIKRAEAAESRLASAMEALTAVVRAANLALFVIRKQGVMPNSSWESGFKSDMKKAEDFLSSLEGSAE